MNKITKILGLSAAGIGAGILPAISFASCSTNLGECITMPSWASFSASNGDWVAGMFSLFQTPLFFGIALILTVGVIGFIVSLIGKAVNHMNN